MRFLRRHFWRWVERRLGPEILCDLYRGVLKRDPDPAGLSSYLDRTIAPPNTAGIIADLIGSDEFQIRNKGTPAIRHLLVDAIFREMLGRPADPYGLASYGVFLEGMGLVTALPKMVTALMEGPEFNRRMSMRVLRGVGMPGGRLVNGRKIAHVVSLGTHCLTGFYLKESGYKRYSLPFDWLFSSPETVLHCLEDDFETMLDPGYYISMGHLRHDGEPGAEHVFYRDRHRVTAMFTHRDPTNEEDRLYFVRAVERFRRVMASGEPKLFVMIVRPGYDAPKTFAALSEKLRAMTADSAFICIQLEHPTRRPGCHSMRLLREDGDHALYGFQPSAPELGVGFDEIADDLAILRLVRDFDMDLAPAPEAEGETRTDAETAAEAEADARVDDEMEAAEEADVEAQEETGAAGVETEARTDLHEG